jgi:surface antigen
MVKTTGIIRLKDKAYMKKIIALMTAVAFTGAITGCSTNTTEQNTTIGAGSCAVAGGLAGTLAKGAGRGWIIAAGAAVGAVIGGLIGHHADSTDQTNMNAAMDNNSINTPSNWKNDKTGVWYKIIPTSGFFTWRDNPNCRHYVAYGKHHGKTIKTRGVACRMADGLWQQVR